jgi:alkyl sulfatase BDS1-like metallo-beta-lactamase superfamily hydrolase
MDRIGPGRRRACVGRGQLEEEAFEAGVLGWGLFVRARRELVRSLRAQGTRAAGAYELGDYRWVAEVVNHIVFADPDNQDARNLQAEALEQLGHQAESGPWRNFYLTGAQELRGGIQQLPTPNAASPDSVRNMSTQLFFDYLGMRLNGSEAGDRTITLGLTMPDVGESWTLMLRNGALSHREGAADDAVATVTIDRAHLNEIILGVTRLADQISSGTATVDGDERGLDDFVALLDEFEFWFDIVTP